MKLHISLEVNQVKLNTIANHLIKPVTEELKHVVQYAYLCKKVVMQTVFSIVDHAMLNMICKSLFCNSLEAIISKSLNGGDILICFSQEHLISKPLLTVLSIL